MVKKWKDKKMGDKRYFVLDKRGLHYFKDPKDVVFDGMGVADISQAAGSWEIVNLRIQPADLTANEFEAEVTERQGTALVERELILKMEASDPRALFDELDADKSGSLDHGELEELCKKMGKKLSKKELTEAMTAMDADGSGHIEFGEFEAWWVQGGNSVPTDTVPQWIAAIDDATEAATGKRPKRAEFEGKKYGAQEADPPPPPPPEDEAPPPPVEVSPPVGVAGPGDVVMKTFSQAGPLGFGFTDDFTSSGFSGAVQVQSIRDGSQAALAGQVVIGATLLGIEANGSAVDCTGMPYAGVLEILKRGERPVTLSFKLPGEPPAPPVPDEAPPLAAPQREAPPPEAPVTAVAAGPPPLCEAVALHDSPAPEPGDLVFKRGDRVQITEQDPSMGVSTLAVLQLLVMYVSAFRRLVDLL